MDWLKNWNKALDYLENNLDGDIRLEELGHLVHSENGVSPHVGLGPECDPVGAELTKHFSLPLRIA